MKIARDVIALFSLYWRDFAAGRVPIINNLIIDSIIANWKAVKNLPSHPVTTEGHHRQGGLSDFLQKKTGTRRLQKRVAN